MEAPVKKTFGGAFPGFATWLSDSGRLAVLYQFKREVEVNARLVKAVGLGPN